MQQQWVMKTTILQRLAKKKPQPLFHQKKKMVEKNSGLAAADLMTGRSQIIAVDDNARPDAVATGDKVEFSILKAWAANHIYVVFEKYNDRLKLPKKSYGRFPNTKLLNTRNWSRKVTTATCIVCVMTA